MTLGEILGNKGKEAFVATFKKKFENTILENRQFRYLGEPKRRYANCRKPVPVKKLTYAELVASAECFVPYSHKGRNKHGILIGRR